MPKAKGEAWADVQFTITVYHDQGIFYLPEESTRRSQIRFSVHVILYRGENANKDQGCRQRQERNRPGLAGSRPSSTAHTCPLQPLARAEITPVDHEMDPL